MKVSRTDYLAQREVALKKAVRKKMRNPNANVSLKTIKHEWIENGPFGFSRFTVDALVNGKLYTLVLDNV